MTKPLKRVSRARVSSAKTTTENASEKAKRTPTPVPGPAGKGAKKPSAAAVSKINTAGDTRRDYPAPTVMASGGHGSTKESMGTDAAGINSATCAEKLEISFKKLFRCSICKKEWKQPMGLPCGHIFCDDCLKNNQPSTSSAAATRRSSTDSSSSLITSGACETCQFKLGRRSVVVPRKDLEALSTLIKRLIQPVKTDAEKVRKAITGLAQLEAGVVEPTDALDPTSQTMMPPPPAPIASANTAVIDPTHPEEASSPSDEKENIHDGVHVKDTALARKRVTIDDLAIQHQLSQDDEPDPMDVDEYVRMDEIGDPGPGAPNPDREKIDDEHEPVHTKPAPKSTLKMTRTKETEHEGSEKWSDSGVSAVTKSRDASKERQPSCKRQTRNSFAQTDNVPLRDPDFPDPTVVDAQPLEEGNDTPSELLKACKPMPAHFQMHSFGPLSSCSETTGTMDCPLDLSMPEAITQRKRGTVNARANSVLTFVVPLDLSAKAKTQNNIVSASAGISRKKILNPVRCTTNITEPPCIPERKSETCSNVFGNIQNVHIYTGSHVHADVSKGEQAPGLVRLSSLSSSGHSGVAKSSISNGNGKKVSFDTQTNSDAFLGQLEYSPKTPTRGLASGSSLSRNSKKRPLSNEEDDPVDGKKRLAIEAIDEDEDRKNEPELHNGKGGTDDIQFLQELDGIDIDSNFSSNNPPNINNGTEDKILPTEPEGREPLPPSLSSIATFADSQQLKMTIRQMEEQPEFNCVMSSTPKSKKGLRRHPTAELFVDEEPEGDQNASLESIEKQMLNFNTMALLGGGSANDDRSSNTPTKNALSDHLRDNGEWPEHGEDSESESDFLVATPNPKSQSVLSVSSAAAPTSEPRNRIKTPSQILREMDEEYEISKKMKLAPAAITNPIDVEMEEFISPSVTNVGKDKPQLAGNRGMDVRTSTNGANTSAKSKSPHLVFCPTRLNASQEFELRKLCDMTGSSFQRTYTNEVTHLIVELVDGRVPHTMKYFSAIADKKWILKYAWVTECLKKGELVNEEAFETARFPNCDRGPKISRLSSGCLFRNVTFFVGHKFSQSGISAQDCKNLLVMFGAKVVEDPSQATENILLIADPLDESFDYKKWYIRKGWLTVTWEWVTDCILSFSVLPFTETGLLNRDMEISRIRLPAGISDDVYTQIDY